MQQEGKIRHIGVSEVDVKTIQQMRKVVAVVTVQNLYNLTNRRHEDVVDYCEEERIGFVPWFPLATGKLAQGDGPLAKAAADHGTSPSQLALAWLLRRSPVMLPIPGTSKVSHLEDNCAAGALELTEAEYQALSDAA
jgi:aryl-alcohol dehydrogenase-like predicted oxidoreductase